MNCQTYYCFIISLSLSGSYTPSDASKNDATPAQGLHDPKDLKGVMPVLDHCLYNGGDGGDVLCSGLRAEASADLELGLRGTEGLLTVVVRRRDGRICQEGKRKRPAIHISVSVGFQCNFAQFGGVCQVL